MQAPCVYGQFGVLTIEPTTTARIPSLSLKMSILQLLRLLIWLSALADGRQQLIAMVEATTDHH